MSDLYFLEEGDLVLSPTGDLGIIDDVWRHHSQQAYIRLKTELGDYLMYPQLGAELHRLRGMPQKPETGQFGEELIKNALTRDTVLANYPISIKSVPTSLTSIRFDIYITANADTQLVLSVEQDLGNTDSEQEREALES